MPRKRSIHYGIMVGCTLLLSVLFACFKGLTLDGVIAYLVIDAVFLAVLLYMLESNRIHKEIGKSLSNQYGSIAGCYTGISVVIFGCYFFPEFTCPAAAIALFMSIIANSEISISCCTFLCVVLSIATDGTYYELAAYCVLILIGAQMAKTMHQKNYRLWGCMILVASGLIIPVVFYYLAYAQSNLWLVLWNGVWNGIAILVYYMLANKLYGKLDDEEIFSIEKIIKEDYPLVLDIKNYSKSEYVHAMKVATIARKCAAKIGANETVAMAAGFYYRIGILEGEPFIENGVRLARENCFPEAIVQILSEYNGEERLPSSRESAIVHMVDACIKKIEMLSQHNLSSSWNQDMVIYQTLNEISSTGVYDESGLSMNQFLIVRELLVREEIGYDNNN